MKLILISDTHGCQVGLPEGDVLIHAGDAFCGDDAASLRSDLRKFGELPHKTKLWVLGNHDLVLTHLLKTQPETAWSLLKSAGVQLLIDESVEIDGLRFYGVGWGTSVTIPTSDVVISHCPAKGMLDQRHPPESEHLGSKLKWKFDVTSYGSPSFGDGNVYVGSADGNLYAFSEAGTLKWKFPTSGFVSSPAVGKDGTIFVGQRMEIFTR